MATKARKVRAKKKVDAGELTRRVGRLVDALRKKPDQNVTLADVAGVTEVLIASLDRYMNSIDTSLYRECQALSSHIAQARTEIAELSPQDLTEKRIPRAGQELDAIVKATEEATSEIMGAAEEMMAADAGDVAALKTIVEAGCMRIFEACAFQDITGQRIAKVVNTLSYIEERLSGLQKALGDTFLDVQVELQPEPDDTRTGDERLLNGPALEGEGINQSDIDALMGGAKPAEPAPAEIPRVVDVLAPQAALEGDGEALPADIEAKIDALFR